MLVSLCALLYDYAGDFILNLDMQKSDLSVMVRRVSRTATLDGGAMIVDNGYTASDATFKLVPQAATQSEALKNAIYQLVKLHSSLTLSTPDGCYLGAISAVNDDMQITFLVKTELTTGL